jgi:hypothetical protein
MEEYLARLFGSQPSYMGQLMGAEDAERLRQEAQRQGLLGTGIGLLMASGPSAQRQNIGQIIGQGLMSGQQAYRGAMQQAVQDKMMGLQLAEMAKKQRAEQALPGLIEGSMVAPQREFTDLERMEMRTPSVATGPAQFDPRQFLQRAAAAGVSPSVAIPLGQQIQSFTTPKTVKLGAGEALVEESTGREVTSRAKPVKYGTFKTDSGTFAYDESNPTASFKIADADGETYTGDAATVAKSLYGTSKVAGLTQTQRDAILKGTAELKRSGATTVGVNVPTQSEFGKGVYSSYESIQNAGNNARQTLGIVNQLSGFLDAGVKTGFGAESRAALNRIGQAIDPNFKVAETAGIEAIQSATAQLVLPQVKSLGANPTDKDLAFIAKSSPELSKSVEGNRLILDALRLKSDRQLADADFASKWVQQNSRMIETNPVAAKAEQDRALENFRQTSPLYVNTGEELRRKFQSLKPGGGTSLPAGVRVTRMP